MKLIDIGYAVGEHKIKVEDLFDDPRLLDKTGITNVYETSETTSDLVLRAASRLKINDLDLVNACILVTQSPDDVLPANSIPIAKRIGLKEKTLAFDINQGCSGFVQALCLIDSILNKYQNILLLTGDRYRSKLSKNDRSTNAIFSDGASASLWSSEGLDSVLYESHISDGSKRDWLYEKFAPQDPTQYLHMSGAEVWTFTLNKVVPEIKSAIQFCLENSLQIEGLYLHQASKVVIDGIQSQLPQFVCEKMPINYNIFGNTVSSTIPILLQQFPMSQGSKKVNIFSGFGVGLSASTAVFGQAS